MASRVLLLSPWFFPLKIIRWQDAIKMKYEGTIDVIVEYDEEVRSPSVTWKMPAVIRLKRMDQKQKKGVKFSRVNVYQRDHWCCQYCGHKFAMQQLSYDHVVPRSSGGKTVWENIVTACRKCNSKKDNKTCDESGMWPKSHPRRPASLPMTPPVVDLSKAPAEWQDYLGQVVAG
jgi:5-methylcytosine-specific restriction endonuclease McrA